MASIINEIIPISGFEVVLQRLGVILLEEVTNQETMQALASSSEVFIERQENYSQAEDVVISVSCNNINFGSFDTKESQGDTTYFIDVYTGGVANVSQSGNDNARLKLHRYVSIIKYVLSSAKYLTLGFPMGFIGGKYLKYIEFQDSYDSQDASFIRYARLTYGVRIQGGQLAWDGIALTGNDTQIKFDLTQKGYKLTFNN